jgi:hypothetical protein
VNREFNVRMTYDEHCARVVIIEGSRVLLDMTYRLDDPGTVENAWHTIRACTARDRK